MPIQNNDRPDKEDDSRPSCLQNAKALENIATYCSPYAIQASKDAIEEEINQLKQEMDDLNKQIDNQPIENINEVFCKKKKEKLPRKLWKGW